MLEYALANLWHRKVSSIISVFAISIGVAMLIVLNGMTTGTLREVTDRMENTGIDLFVFYGKWDLWGDLEEVPLDYADYIVEGLAGAGLGRDAILPPMPVLQDKIKRLGRISQDHRIWAMRPDDLAEINIRKVRGEWMESGAFEMMIDTKLAERSGLEVGDYVHDFHGRDWKVVGVYEDGAAVRVLTSFKALHKAMPATKSSVKKGEYCASLFLIKRDKGDVDDICRAIPKLRTPSSEWKFRVGPARAGATRSVVVRPVEERRIPTAMEGDFEGIAGVKDAVPVFLRNPIRLKGKERVVWGVSANAMKKLMGLARVSGDWPREGENEFLVREDVAGETGLTAGKSLKIGEVSWKVSGIFSGADDVDFLTTDTALRKTQDFADADAFLLTYDDGADPKAMEAALGSVTEKGLKMDLNNIKTGAFFEELKKLAGIIYDFVDYVNIVALSISFLVILLTMYNVVLERTRDIGILKSIGASKTYIVSSVILESLGMCVGGVILGFVLSFTAADIIPRISLLSVKITWDVTAVAALVGVVGGLLGGLYPAILASRKDPVVALTYE